MDVVVTPQPHFIPGYTGHCPQFRFREGKTYGKLTHKLLIDPCTNHAPDLIVNTPSQPTGSSPSPTEKEVNLLRQRAERLDAVYRHPVIPGYDGFVPNMRTKVGKRWLAAATGGIAEHEMLMERQRCEHRFLTHHDLLESGRGLFEHKLGERLMPMTTYRSPLIPVQERSKAFEMLDCNYTEKKQPYTKHTVPHFMYDDDEEKFIINGYAGHIPANMSRYGETNKLQTHNALCDFSKRFYHRISAEWCPMESAGVGSICPNLGTFVIYHRTIGMIPSYAGHVPGKDFSFGRTYGNSTVDAKRWLALHKE